MKILAITTIRSDYDLLSNLYKMLHNDENIDFKLLVSGAHMSPYYGYSLELIRKDGFEILAELETLIDSNSSASRAKTAAILLLNSVDIVSAFNPDLIIYAGDREDTMIGGMIGSYLNIPTLHFFGGDHTMDGHIDNPIRHAVSKLSTIHFVALENHRKRLLKIGENSQRIFNIGSVALDKFYNHKEIKWSDIEKIFDIDSSFKHYAIVIFHPVEYRLKDSSQYFENILNALIEKNISAFISHPNTDPGNKSFNKVIEKYHKNRNFRFYKNLDRDIFLTIYKNAFLQLGNSSAGIMEAASIPIPVINVGKRQFGREHSGNVLFCDLNKESIKSSIDTALSKEFSNRIQKISNIYGDGKSSQKAYRLIKEIDFKSYLYKIEDPLGVKYE